LIRRLTFLLALFAGLFPAALHASVTIYYDDPDGSGNGLRHANMLYHLVAHFDPEVQTADVTTYRTGDLARASHAIYLGSQGHTLPDDFLLDVALSGARVLWIGANFGQLFNAIGEEHDYGFSLTGWTLGATFDRLEFRGRVLERKAGRSFFTTVVHGLPHIYSMVSSSSEPGKRFPHFLCAGSLCYLAENPLPFTGIDDRPLLLADLLHEFFETGSEKNLRAMVRFEDLAPGVTDSQRLKKIGLTLFERGIPFSLGVIPVFTDPEGLYGPRGRTWRLSDDPDFVDAIRLLTGLGATLIMHGYTHQHDQGISRVDWEFTLGFDNVPIPADSAFRTRQRIRLGLAEFAAHGFRPRIWETPHYSASHGDYQIFAEFFDAFYCRPLLFPIAASSPGLFGLDLRPINQVLPYDTQTGPFGVPVLPENLGYIDASNPFTAPEALVERAEAIALVRDGIASFYVHDNIPERDLFTVVDGLIGLGFTFVGPDDFLSR
jgi:Uncharacterized protein conserved in bacteria (DUF2334)